MDLKRLIFSLLFSLCAGTFLSFAAVRRERVGTKYFFYHGLIVAVFALGAWLTLAPASVGLFPLGLVAAAVVYSTQIEKRPNLAKVAFVVGVFFSVLVLRLVGKPFPASLYLSTLLLGFSMAAMLLGHWYLSVPGLSIEELRRVVLLFFLFLVVRTLVAAWNLAPLVAGKSEMDLYRYFFSSTSGIFLTMRWFWGLIGPLGLAYFIWETVKLSSTRSATGILYVAVVFVLIGETMAQYLAYFHGLPG